SALVAVPEPAGSNVPSSVRPLDPALLRPVAIALPDGSTAMTVLELDPAQGSADRLEPDSTFVASGSGEAVERGRPVVGQPVSPVGSVLKNYWRVDRDACWDGPGFYGRRAACGHALATSRRGVAHRTLPCGTLVEFRNPSNGRSI